MIDTVDKRLEGWYGKTVNFETFFSTLPRASKKALGDAFERVTEHALLNSLDFGPQIDKIVPWDEWEGATSRDLGIDLIAYMKNGDLWAIQAKGYEYGTSLTYRDVATFMAAASKDIFAERVIVSSAGSLGANLEKQIADSDYSYKTLLADWLEGLDWPSSYSDHLASLPKPVPDSLRGYQIQARDDVLSLLSKRNRAQYISACGTGKTLTMWGIWEGRGKPLTGVFAPTLSLLSQLVSVWRKQEAGDIDVLIVCSDETVGKRREWAVPVKVTSDVEEIRTFLLRKKGLIFCTYQSAHLLAAAKARFDLILADEAHRLASRGGVRGAEVLDDSEIYSHKRVFATATPRILGQNLKNSEDAVDIASMDDEKVFGKVAYKLTFGQAIEMGILSDYQVLVLGVDSDDVQKAIERRSFVSTGDKARDAWSVAAEIALEKARKEYGAERVISYHHRLKDASSFSQGLNALGIRSDYLDGKMSAFHRNVLINRLAAEGGVLTNARTLQEGVDVPNLDGVVFVDPKESTVDIVQSVGRVLRKYPGKKHGLIIIPIPVSRDDNVDNIAERTGYKALWKVLNALSSVDDVLYDEMTALRRELGAKGSVAHLPGKITLDLPKWSKGQLEAAVRLKAVEFTGLTEGLWTKRYNEMLEYCKLNGRPPTSRDKENWILADWAITQRSAKKNGHISDERIQLLDKIPGWFWFRDKDALWVQNYDRLLNFVRTQGHLPTQKEPEGRWLNIQRQYYRRGDLDRNKTELLESIPGWRWNDYSKDWEARFRDFEFFVLKTGHLPRKEDGDIYTWMCSQRTYRAKGILRKDRETLLMSTNPATFVNKLDAKWFNTYQEVCRFYEENDRFPFQSEPNGNWIASNRRARRTGRISKERFNILNNTKGWKWDATFDSNFGLKGRHTRWHVSKPNPECEFCQEEGLV